MGLDAIELVLELEERLGIEICEEERLSIVGTTVENAHRILMDKLNGAERTVPVFWPFARGVYHALNRLTPWWKGRNYNDLNKKFPPMNRVEIWQELEKELSVLLPDLEYAPNGEYPVIPRICDSGISMVFWIAEHYPERLEWAKVSCERSGKMADRTWNEDEVWEILRQSIVDMLDVKPEEVTPDARLVEDLGME
jgi:acyl carrier protein